ncbi:hypothetical protein [uncultured Chryseobacterium sp.]|uniref:hypothetical protein n=1 Tax=uncultured Chryseobacterium sp. TaxID=259322 RepID=UPI003749F061
MSNKNYKYLIGTILVLLIAYNVYSTFFYKGKYSINKFGTNYNDFRKKNNIPLLPNNWILETSPNKFTNFHSPDMTVLGHRIKYINLLKSDIGAEMDKFYFTKDSILEARYERNTGNKFLYIYTGSELKNKQITYEQANSILKKLNINFRFNSTWSSNFNRN